MRAITVPVLAVLAACAVVTGQAAPALAASWSIAVAMTTTGQARGGTAPSAPNAATASCQSIASSTIVVSWSAVARATRYTVSDSTVQTGTYTPVATTSTTSTSIAGLASGTYFFEVTATIGSSWDGPPSASTSQRTIVSAPPPLPVGTCT